MAGGQDPSTIQSLLLLSSAPVTFFSPYWPSACFTGIRLMRNHRSPKGPYTFKKGDPNGIGKWYMGREIAYVMGYQGMGWLERPEREAEEKTSTLIENLEIRPEDRIADIGAGSGYHVFRMAPLA